jgi:hypothetical protein
MSRRRRTNRLAYRLVGPPPSKGASRAERLRYVNRFYWRWNTPIVVVGSVIIIVLGWWYVAVVLLALQALVLASSSAKIRREESRRH